MSDISSSESGDGADSQELFEVEKVCDHRLADDGNSYEYEIKWKNYSYDENTWEPVEHLSGCRRVLKTYQLRAFGRVLLSDSSDEDKAYTEHVFLTDRDVFTTGSQDSGPSRAGPVIAKNSLQNQLESSQISSQESEKCKKRSKKRFKKEFERPPKDKKKEKSPVVYNELMKSITSDTGMETELDDEDDSSRKSKKKRKGGRVALEEDLEPDPVEQPAEPAIKKDIRKPFQSPPEVLIRPSIIELNSADESTSEEVSWADKLRLDTRKSVEAATSSKQNEPGDVKKTEEAPEKPPLPKVTKKTVKTFASRAPKTSRPSSRNKNQEQLQKTSEKRSPLVGAMKCGVQANTNAVVDAPRSTPSPSLRASGSLSENRASNPVQAPSLNQGPEIQPRIVNQFAPAPQKVSSAPQRPPSLYQGGIGVQDATPSPNNAPQRDQNFGEVPQIVAPQRAPVVFERPIENMAHREDPLPIPRPIDPPIRAAPLSAEEFIRQLERQPVLRQPAQRRVSDSVPSDPTMTPRSDPSQIVVNQPPPIVASTPLIPRRAPNLPAPAGEFRPIPLHGQQQHVDQAREAFRTLDPRLRDRRFHLELPLNVSAEEFIEIIDLPDEPVDRKPPVYIPDYMRISSPHFDPDRMRSENRQQEIPAIPRIERRNVREMFEILEQMKRRAAEEQEDPMLRYEGPSVSSDEVRSAVIRGQGVRHLLPDSRRTDREFRDLLRQRDEELLDGQEIPQSPESLPSSPHIPVEIESLFFGQNGEENREESKALTLQRGDEQIRIDPVEFGPSHEVRIEGLDTPGPSEAPVLMEEARLEPIISHGEDNLEIDIDHMQKSGGNIDEISTQSRVEQVQVDGRRKEPSGNEGIDHQQNATGSSRIPVSDTDNSTGKPTSADVSLYDVVPVPFQMQDASGKSFCLNPSTIQPVNVNLVDNLGSQRPTTSSIQIPPQYLTRTTELGENLSQPTKQISPNQQIRQNKRKKSHPMRCIPLTENEMEAMNSQAVTVARPTENLKTRNAQNLVLESGQSREKEGQVQSEDLQNPLEAIARLSQQFNEEAEQMESEKKTFKRLSDVKKTNSNNQRSSNQPDFSQMPNLLPQAPLKQSICPVGSPQQSPRRRLNQEYHMTPQMLAQFQQIARQGNQPNIGNFMNPGQIPNVQMIQPGQSLAQRTHWPQMSSPAEMAGQAFDISNPNSQMKSPAQIVSPAQNMARLRTPNSSTASPAQMGSGLGNSSSLTASPVQQGQVISLPNSQMPSPAQQIQQMAGFGNPSPSTSSIVRNRPISGNSGGMVPQQGLGMPNLAAQVTVQAQQMSNRTQTMSQSMMNQIHQQIFTQHVVTTQTNQMAAQPQQAANSGQAILGTCESIEEDLQTQSEVREIVKRLKEMDEERKQQRQNNSQAPSLTVNIPLRLYEQLARTNGSQLAALSQALQQGSASVQGFNNAISRPRGAQQGMTNSQGLLPNQSMSDGLQQGMQPQMLTQFEQALLLQNQKAEYLKKLQQNQQMQGFGQAQQGLGNPQQGSMPGIMGQGNFQQAQGQLQYGQGQFPQNLGQFTPNFGFNAQGQFQQQVQSPKQRRTRRRQGQGSEEFQLQPFPAPYQGQMNVQGLQALGQMANPQQMQQRPKNFAQGGFQSSTGSMGSVINNSASFNQVTTQSMVQFPQQQASMTAPQMQMPFQQQQMAAPQGYVQVVEQVYVQNVNPQRSFNSSNCSNPEQMFGQSNFLNSSGSALDQVPYNPALSGEERDGAFPQFLDGNS